MSIIRVEKLTPGWEAIPNNFVNDLCLSEDALAVGLWLAIKPAGWQVRPVVIQAEFSRRPGKLRGRDWWARVSGELKLAGYLRLNTGKDEKGQFSSSWDFCVFGLSKSFPDVCSADVGSAAHGSSGDGLSYKSNQHQLKPVLKIHTQHNDIFAAPAKQGVCVDVEFLLSSFALSIGTRKLIEKELSALPDDLQIAIIREFVTHRNSIRNPVPWMRRICTDTLISGEFILKTAVKRRIVAGQQCFRRPDTSKRQLQVFTHAVPDGSFP